MLIFICVEKCFIAKLSFTFENNNVIIIMEKCVNLNAVLEVHEINYVDKFY